MKASSTRGHQTGGSPSQATAKRGEISSRDDTATADCPVCERRFTPQGRARYCCEACRKQARRRQHRPDAVPVVVPPPGRPRRPITVYECGSCGSRALGGQRCDECATFMARVGVGGLCPHCDGAVALEGLLEPELIDAATPTTAEHRRAAKPQAETAVPPDTTRRRS